MLLGEDKAVLRVAGLLVGNGMPPAGLQVLSLVWMLGRTPASMQSVLAETKRAFRACFFFKHHPFPFHTRRLLIRLGSPEAGMRALKQLLAARSLPTSSENNEIFK